jgi:YggT family protein
MNGLVLALTRNDIADYVAAVFRVYGLLIIAYILTSLFFSFGGRLPYSRWSRAILEFLHDVSEPLLRPFRAILPMLGPLDLSPIVALIVLQIVGAVVVGLIRP